MMAEALAKTETTEKNIYETLALRGDLSGLNPKDKAIYLQKLSESLGLNFLTQPFIPLKLNGKEILYASRGATDQLASIHKLTREIIRTERLEDVYIVTCKVVAPDGRFDISTGAVTIGNLKGDALCNALMKAESKAKRRAVLSFCGLGFLDQSELETIPKNRIEYPTKAELVAGANEDNFKNAPSVETNYSTDEMAATMREQIHLAQTARLVNPAAALAKFDNLETLAEKAEAVRGSLKSAAAHGINGQNWDAGEIDVYLSGYGIDGGLDSATNEQLETVFNEMKKDKML